MHKLLILKLEQDNLYSIYKKERDILKNYEIKQKIALIKSQKLIVNNAQGVFVKKHNEYVNYKNSLNQNNDNFCT